MFKLTAFKFDGVLRCGNVAACSSLGFMELLRAARSAGADRNLSKGLSNFNPIFGNVAIYLLQRCGSQELRSRKETIVIAQRVG